jgi:triphosphoribosyl-dephospho-CoA synthase
MSRSDIRWTAEEVASAAQLAAILEVSAEKPGNVTPTHDFSDMSYEDMLRSALVLGPELARAAERGVGATVLAIVAATRTVCAANTNLGIALLVAPLARAALTSTDGRRDLRELVRETLAALSLADARDVYAAIRLAAPGGLEERVEHDVRDEPVVGLLDAMAHAAHRDRIASEYVTGFAVTFELAVPALARALADGLAPREAIVELHLRLLADLPDTLIARKRGPDVAQRVSRDAVGVLAAGGVRSAAGRAALARFDAALRDPGNALNPGATADLVAAAVFVALLEHRV